MPGTPELAFRMPTAWENATYLKSIQSTARYFQNLNPALQADQNTNLSLKVICFLDYHQVRQKMKMDRVKQGPRKTVGYGSRADSVFLLSLREW